MSIIYITESMPSYHVGHHSRGETRSGLPAMHFFCFMDFTPGAAIARPPRSINYNNLHMKRLSVRGGQVNHRSISP